ncbi:MAG: DUF5996 family protein [Rhodomicrobium sp.]
MTNSPQEHAWPELPYQAWKDTCDTLHLCTQIAGKIRLAHTPWLNHSWHVPFYLTAKGLTTSPIPYADSTFEIEFDFNEHFLQVVTGDGYEKCIDLVPRTVAEFYSLVMQALDDLNIAVKITELPAEIPDAIPFSQDRIHSAYDAGYANRFRRVLVQADRVLKLFRTGFIGKASPVHFFWGSFDLAVTRFSGRRAPPHPGGAPGLSDAVMREAYSHELSSAGFWPGGNGIDYAAFYSYAYPTPEGFSAYAIKPEAAFFHQGLGEFILPYDAVRTASDPDAMLLAFLQSTYEAAANLARWDRSSLECPFGVPGVARV